VRGGTSDLLVWGFCAGCGHVGGGEARSGLSYATDFRPFDVEAVAEEGERSERAGKSPAELLNASPHPHWLELLGYVRFSRS